ncbi:helix-turn-helix domain-containing protein [Paenibacillus qinlingensis]|uniref:helix-turn-helix domain-containing protein n=1 Tax=Paenibacillus qinlingensis TaxID=1837343 RepID=UPI001563D925|nr:AraC family transcriptional regulator [Paenibacillus qinlingensis]NQX60100.1 helix-turn-helix transcriptional regulator [Paenibacillus qinlingensis]
MKDPKGLMDEYWHIRLYQVEEAFYKAIDIQNLIYPYWVVSFIVEGQVDVEDGSKSQTARAGQVMLHAPGMPFAEKSATPGLHLWMLIDVRNSYQVDLFRLYPLTEVMTMIDPAAYSAIFYKLLAAWQKKDSPFREIEISAIGMQVVHLLLESWDQNGRVHRNVQAGRNGERLEKVISYIHTSFHEKVTRKTLAHLLHLNTNYLDKIFMEEYQMNPMQMIRELRLKKAKGMLENGNDSLTDIASACGLGDASYLSHQFVKRFGVNPGKYREQVRQTRQSYYHTQENEV